jgi:hypothetical protein
LLGPFPPGQDHQCLPAGRSHGAGPESWTLGVGIALAWHRRRWSPLGLRAAAGPPAATPRPPAGRGRRILPSEHARTVARYPDTRPAPPALLTSTPCSIEFRFPDAQGDPDLAGVTKSLPREQSCEIARRRERLR